MYEPTDKYTKRAIVVDHDQATAELIAELLRGDGIAPLCYPSWLLSVACIKRAQANLLILDLGLGDPSTLLDLLGELRRNLHTRSLPVIVNSTDERMLGWLDEPLHELGCLTLAKPFDLDEFSALVGACLRAWPGQVDDAAC